MEDEWKPAAHPPVSFRFIPAGVRLGKWRISRKNPPCGSAFIVRFHENSRRFLRFAALL
ncbi:MAG: hypothetical protein J6Z45_01450 [Oscillospiraceae bacterium]|nr:hypothetical protein [Oscillospiraceae bacterium]